VFEWSYIVDVGGCSDGILVIGWLLHDAILCLILRNYFHVVQCYVLLHKVPTLIAFVPVHGIITSQPVLTGDSIYEVPTFTVFMPAHRNCFHY